MLSISDTSKLLNIAIATNKIKTLKTEHYDLRPTMHVIICGRIGAAKSTILRELCKVTKSELPTFGLTSATILGTIDKQTGVFIPPATWICRNSVLGIDEFDVDITSVKHLKVLLGVLEHPEYSKSMGYRCNDYTERSKGLFCIVKGGRIYVKTRFQLIVATMLNLHKKQRMIELEALKTRCIVLPLYPSLEEFHSIIHGESLFKYENLEPEQNVFIDNNMIDYFHNFMLGHDISEENYMRTFGDLCRAYAVIGKDEKMFKLIATKKSED